MDAFRVVVVDDSALFRMALRNVLTEIPGCEVVASVAEGKSALEKIEQLRPDLVTLDLEMPDMDGIGVLRELRRRKLDAKVVMISRFTTAGAQVTTDALIEGAFDFVLKPSGKDPAENKRNLRQALEERITALRDRTVVSSEPGASSTTRKTQSVASAPPCDAVFIGCSTGGPDALARIIPDLPGNFPVPIFIVQHMPDGFTASLAARLNEASALEVIEAHNGLIARGGQVVLARGGRHLKILRQVAGGVAVQLTEDPPLHSCRPAVDYTLRSAHDVLSGRMLVAILTGMGRDGMEGCQLVRASGAYVIAQQADGCTVYGMPKAVIAAGLADQIVKLPAIAGALTRAIESAISAKSSRS